MKNSIQKNMRLLNRLCYQAAILSLLIIITIPSKAVALAEHDELITRVKQGNDHQIQKILKNVETNQGPDAVRELINHLSEDSLSPMHWAASRGHNDILSLLFARGASPDPKGQNNWTPLHLAAINGYDQTVVKLLELGVNIDSVDDNGWNVVHLAAAQGHIKVLKTLFDEQARFNAQGWGGWTPLFNAAYAGEHEVVKWLIDTDVIDPNQFDKFQKTALDYAIENEHQEIVKILSLVTD